MSSAKEQAVTAARLAYEALSTAQTRDAAWLALYGLELDPEGGLALALLARIVHEMTQDPLATVATRRALQLGLPDPEARGVARFHRIDLWNRGLLAHRDERAVLPATTFDDATAFSPTPREAPWFEGELFEWGGEDGVVLAIRRMVAAFADAWVVPRTEGNPLREPGIWAEAPAYAAWKASAPLSGRAAEPTSDGSSAELVVLSDHWIEQEIASLGLAGQFELARERAEAWVTARPDRLAPRATLVRVLAAGGWDEARDEAVGALLARESDDLNELEEARMALGEIGLFEAQVTILDRMDRLAPGHPVILANRGVARLQLGAKDAGVADLEAALAADPDSGPALANLALERMKADEYVEARRLLERAVQVAPQEPQVRVYLAACKNNQEDRVGAIAELQEALRLDPDHAQAKFLLEELQSRGPS